MILKNKKILVTGGTGMIGRALCNKLVKDNTIFTASLDGNDRKVPYSKEHFQVDLRDPKICNQICKGMDIVFHLAGIKGSPKLTQNKPATFFVNTSLFNLNMLDAISKSNLDWALYTSSVGVYAPAKVFYEDTVWSTFPSEYDKFAGWAKRMGELQIEAYAIENKINHFSIIRPSNVYGPFDNFDLETSMVVPATIVKVLNAKNEITMWGNGSPIRDFVYSGQVADQMIWMVENKINTPLNCGSGHNYSIKDMVEKVIEITGKNIEVKWDTSKPTGDQFRTMDMSKTKSLGFNSTYSLEQGLKETINWYTDISNRSITRYDAFKE